jgi:hypothetical protein
VGEITVPLLSHPDNRRSIEMTSMNITQIASLLQKRAKLSREKAKLEDVEDYLEAGGFYPSPHYSIIDRKIDRLYASIAQLDEQIGDTSLENDDDRRLVEKVAELREADCGFDDAIVRRLNAAAFRSLRPTAKRGQRVKERAPLVCVVAN